MSTPPLPHPPDAPARVLLVEDDPVSRAFLAAAVAALPARVDPADSLAAAMALAQQHTYDLWLFDAHLPDGSGIELLVRLRGHAAWPIAVAHTASRDLDAAAALRAAGFVAVLVKPITAMALQATLGPLLRPRSVAEAPAAWDDTTALVALNGQAAHVDALRKLFLDELPDVRDAVLAAASARDEARLRGLLHRLQASCGFVGAAQLGTTARQLHATPDSSAVLQDFTRAVAALLASA